MNSLGHNGSSQTNSPRPAGIYEDLPGRYELPDWVVGAFVAGVLLAAALIQQALAALLPYPG